MKKISVIIPAYNVEPYIEQCAYSVLNQTLKEIEIIFIDDGSTDKTGIMLDNLVRGHENAQVIHQDNKGLYQSRQIGIAHATGDYIGWVDADDYVEFNMFEVLYNVAIENESELVICDYSCLPQKKGIKEKWFREYTGKVDTTYVEQNSQVWNKIVKRDLMERLGIGSLFVSCFDEIYILLLMKAKNPVTISSQLYHYRIGSNTMSSSYTNVAHYRRFVNASKELRKVMRSIYEETYWNDYFDYRISYYLLATMIVAANTGDIDAYKNNRKELLSIEPRYYKNQHFWRILKRNFGLLKAIFIGSIIPIGYSIARIVCKIGFKYRT